MDRKFGHMYNVRLFLLKLISETVMTSAIAKNLTPNVTTSALLKRHFSDFWGKYFGHLISRLKFRVRKHLIPFLKSTNRELFGEHLNLDKILHLRP